MHDRVCWNNQGISVCGEISLKTEEGIIVGRYVDYTRKVRGGDLDIKRCNKKGMIRRGAGVLQICPCLSPY